MIEDSLYNQIVNCIPIVCVDGFIIDNERKILLMKRNNYPAKGEWWVPGGRVLKDELLKDSIRRKIKDETDLDVISLEQVGITETIFENKHTINICFKIQTSSYNIKLNDEHSDYFWYDSDNLPEDLNINLKNKIFEII